MNVKTYTYVKYIATVGSLFLFIAPLLGFLQAYKHIFKSNLSAMYGTSWAILIVGIIIDLVYVYIRNRLKMKSGYKYTKADNTKLTVSYSMYGVMMVLSLVYVLISCISSISPKAIEWTFLPFYVLIFASAILAAIYESMSRVQEQIYLYQEQEKRKDDVTVSDTGTKRTTQAQMLLNEDEKKSKKVSKKSKSTKTATIKDKDLQDFFNNKKGKKDKDDED